MDLGLKKYDVLGGCRTPVFLDLSVVISALFVAMILSCSSILLVSCFNNAKTV